MSGDGGRCPACGAVAPVFAGWCPGCGTALDDEAPAPPPTGAQPSPPPRPPPPPPSPSAWDDEADSPPMAPAPAPASAPVPTPAPPTKTSSAGGRRRMGVATALAVAVLAALSPWDGDGGEQAAPTTTTTSTPSTTRGTRFTRPPTSSTTSTTTTRPPPDALPEPTGGTRLVLVRGGRVEVVDIDARTVTAHDVPEFDPRGEGQPLPQFAQPPTFVRRGDHLVFQARGATWALPLDFSTGARRLGDSERFLAGAGEDRVWLAAPSAAGPPTVREVDLQGRDVGPPVALPADWTPTAALEGGLVLARGDRFMVWDPATGRARLDVDGGASPLAAGGTTLAWRYYCEGPFCPLHLTDVATGRDRLVHLENTYFGPGGGAFSPDGRTLALFVSRADGRLQGQAVAFVTVATGAVAYGGEAPAGEQSAPVWSASGRWLFTFTAPMEVFVHRPGLEEPMELDLNRASEALVAW